MKDLGTPPSGLFRSITTSGGSLCQATCDFCGRTHFVSGRGHGDFSIGELESLMQMAEKQPDKYIHHPEDDCISTGEINGIPFVSHCQCNNLSRYEDFIWNERHLIIAYLTRRTSEEFEAAKDLHSKTSKMLQLHNAMGRVGGNFLDIIRSEIEQAKKDGSQFP